MRGNSAAIVLSAAGLSTLAVAGASSATAATACSVNYSLQSDSRTRFQPVCSTRPTASPGLPASIPAGRLLTDDPAGSAESAAALRIPRVSPAFARAVGFVPIVKISVDLIPGARVA